MKNKINIIRGDITKISVDAIVNAANTSLLGGGGVDGAIHRVGGVSILEECQKIKNRQGNCKVGDAVITSAGKLPARYVIHTVAPFWSGGNNNESKLLKIAYDSCFQLVKSYNIKTVSFPNIGTGIYRFPKEAAAKIALAVIITCLSENQYIEAINIVCFEEDNYQIYLDLMSN